MVDVTVPARERRHAILPDINPIRKSNKPGKPGKGGRGGIGEEPINEADEHPLADHPQIVVPPPQPSSKLLSLNTKLKTIFNKKSDANSADHDPESPVLELGGGAHRGRRGAKSGNDDDEAASPFQRRKKPIDIPENPIAKCKARKRIITEEMKPPGHNSFSAMTFLDAPIKTTSKPPPPAEPPAKTCNSNKNTANSNDHRNHNSNHNRNENSNSFTAINISPVVTPPPPSPAPIRNRSQRRRAAIFNEPPPDEFDIEEDEDDPKNQQQHNFYLNNNYNAHAYARNSYSDVTSNDESAKSDVEFEEDPPPEETTDFLTSNNSNSNRQSVSSTGSLGQNSVNSTDDRAIFNPLLMTECL